MTAEWLCCRTIRRSRLILPTDYNSFIKTSDDYYNRWEIASFERLLRYFASFFAMTLPDSIWRSPISTQILPTTLLLSFADARSGVPFPAVIEVIIMELSFELLREAGVRLPGAMGEYDWNCGGLIIGQAAVEANLVSPIVVIVISFTALCSFAVPNEEFATAFRLLKFFLSESAHGLVFRVSGRAACRADPSVALKKLWRAVPDAVCGGRSERL